jgi:hypothetical protein
MGYGDEVDRGLFTFGGRTDSSTNGTHAPRFLIEKGKTAPRKRI